MKAEQRRAQVLAVARDVFAEKGYHAAKIDDIVARARVARGTFYLYFADKRSVFGELLDGLLAGLRQSIHRVDMDGTTSVEDQLRANVRRVLAILFEERALTKILLSDAVGLDAGFDEKLLSFYDQIYAVIEGALAEGLRLGLVHSCDPAMAACVVVGSLKEIVYRGIFRRYYVSVDDAVNALFDLHGRAFLS